MAGKVLEDGPHPVDRHVGRLVAEQRVSFGYTQTDLARALDLTFQQVQKYEKGANRISASKLWDIATFLNLDIGYFFVVLPEGDTGNETAKILDPDGPPTRTTLEITRLARQLSTSQQKLALNLMAEMAKPGEMFGGGRRR